MNDVIVPLVRRAILDLLNDIGGEHNLDTLGLLLEQLGHRIARRDMRPQMNWLVEGGFIGEDCLGDMPVWRISADGRDVADGKLVVDGIRKFKTGE